MNEHELAVLRQLIEQHEFLEVVEEASNEHGLAVLDNRAGTCIVVDCPDGLADLVSQGAEWYLSSPWNGVGHDVPVVKGANVTLRFRCPRCDGTGKVSHPARLVEGSLRQLD